MSLRELAEEYRSDKVNTILHDYIPTYERLLYGREIQRVLEIGIGTMDAMRHVNGYQPGASLRMWRDYFPGAEIWGVDIHPGVMVNEVRIRSMVGDQSNTESLLHIARTVGGRFDFIVDDGSHNLDHQALTANTLIPLLLAKKGVYVIEDVIWRKDLYALLPWPVEVKICDLKRTPDDCLFIIEGSKI